MMMMPGGYNGDDDNNDNNANNNNNNNNDVIEMTNKKRLALIKKGRVALNTLMPIELGIRIQDKIHFFFGNRKDLYGKQDTKDTTLYEAMMKFTSINQNNKKLLNGGTVPLICGSVDYVMYRQRKVRSNYPQRVYTALKKNNACNNISETEFTNWFRPARTGNASVANRKYGKNFFQKNGFNLVEDDNGKVIVKRGSSIVITTNTYKTLVEEIQVLWKLNVPLEELFIIYWKLITIKYWPLQIILESLNNDKLGVVEFLQKYQRECNKKKLDTYEETYAQRGIFNGIFGDKVNNSAEMNLKIHWCFDEVMKRKNYTIDVEALLQSEPKDVQVIENNNKNNINNTEDETEDSYRESFHSSADETPNTFFLDAFVDEDVKAVVKAYVSVPKGVMITERVQQKIFAPGEGSPRVPYEAVRITISNVAKSVAKLLHKCQYAGIKLSDSQYIDVFVKKFRKMFEKYQRIFPSLTKVLKLGDNNSYRVESTPVGQMVLFNAVRLDNGSTRRPGIFVPIPDVLSLMFKSHSTVIKANEHTEEYDAGIFWDAAKVTASLSREGNHETAFVVKPLKSKLVLNRRSVACFSIIDGKDDYHDCKQVFKQLLNDTSTRIIDKYEFENNNTLATLRIRGFISDSMGVRGVEGLQSPAHGYFGGARVNNYPKLMRHASDEIRPMYFKFFCGLVKLTHNMQLIDFSKKSVREFWGLKQIKIPPALRLGGDHFLVDTGHTSWTNSKTILSLIQKAMAGLYGSWHVDLWCKGITAKLGIAISAISSWDGSPRCSVPKAGYASAILVDLYEYIFDKEHLGGFEPFPELDENNACKSRVQPVKKACIKICELWHDLNHVFLGDDAVKYIEDYVAKAYTFLHIIKNGWGSNRVTPYLTEIVFFNINCFRRLYSIGVLPQAISIGPLEEHHWMRKSLLPYLKSHGFPRDHNEFYDVKANEITRLLQLNFGTRTTNDVETLQKKVVQRKLEFNDENVLFEHAYVAKRDKNITSNYNNQYNNEDDFNVNPFGNIEKELEQLVKLHESLALDVQQAAAAGEHGNKRTYNGMKESIRKQIETLKAAYGMRADEFNIAEDEEVEDEEVDVAEATILQRINNAKIKLDSVKCGSFLFEKKDGVAELEIDFNTKAKNLIISTSHEARIQRRETGARKKIKFRGNDVSLYYVDINVQDKDLTLYMNLATPPTLSRNVVSTNSKNTGSMQQAETKANNFCMEEGDTSFRQVIAKIDYTYKTVFDQAMSDMDIRYDYWADSKSDDPIAVPTEYDYNLTAKRVAGDSRLSIPMITNGTIFDKQYEILKTNLNAYESSIIHKDNYFRALCPVCSCNIYLKPTPLDDRRILTREQRGVNVLNGKYGTWFRDNGDHNDDTIHDGECDGGETFNPETHVRAEPSKEFLTLSEAYDVAEETKRKAESTGKPIWLPEIHSDFYKYLKYLPTGAKSPYDIAKEKFEKLKINELKRQLLYDFDLSSIGSKILLLDRLINAKLDVQNRQEILTDESWLFQVTKLKLGGRRLVTKAKIKSFCIVAGFSADTLPNTEARLLSAILHEREEKVLEAVKLLAAEDDTESAQYVTTTTTTSTTELLPQQNSLSYSVNDILLRLNDVNIFKEPFTISNRRLILMLDVFVEKGILSKNEENNKYELRTD